MQAQKITDKPYFENLDGLRFACFFMVFMAHSFFATDLIILQAPAYKFLKFDVVRNGIIGVNFFFVLSGFLITFLLLKEKNKNGRINVPFFWIRRILRIWPLYFACVFFGFVIFPQIKLMAGQVVNENANPWYYITFLSNFDIIRKGLPDCSVLGILWSVAIEEQFYLIWPVLLSFFNTRYYWIVFAVIILSSLVFNFNTDSYEPREYHTIACISDMAIGGLASWLLQFNVFLKGVQKITRIQVIFGYVLFLLLFFLKDDMEDSFFLGRVFMRFTISLVVVFIILEQCYCTNSFFKFSRSRIFTRLGVISYGLYCLHFLGILIAIQIFKLLHPSETYLLVFVLVPLSSLAFTIVLASFSYRFFESPFLRMKKRFEK